MQNETTLSRRATVFLASPRGSRWIVGLFTVGMLVGTVGRDVRRPLWHDEIFTLYVASASATAGLWNVLSTGVDLNPPLYYLCVRIAAAVVGYGSLATRLPSTLGFLVACLALYVFMRRRVHPWFAIVAALSMALTSAVVYAYEGRPYGLLLGLSAVALTAWQWRSERRGPAPLILCALALAAAVFTHFYAVLMVVPLAAGEATRVFHRRRIDWAMWMVLGLGIGVPLLMLRPLVRAARQFAATFWSGPTTEKLMAFYRELPEPLALLLIIAVACIAISVVLWPGNANDTLTPPRDASGRTGFRPDEAVATVVMAFLPVVGFLVALKTGAFHGRYVIQAVLALSIFVGWGFSVLISSRRQAAILLATLFVAFGGRTAAGALGIVTGPADPLQDAQPLLSKMTNDVPLVASHVLDYLPLAHYADEGLRARLRYLLEPPPDPRLGLKTADRAMRLLSDLAPLRVEDLDAFVNTHEHFYIYGRRSFLVPALLARGASVRFLGQNDEASLYVVDVTR